MKRAIQTLIRFNLVIASGGCAKAVYFSLVFAGVLDAIPLIIVWLLTWQIYTLDRVIKQPEDKLTQRRSVAELVFMQKQAKWFKLAIMVSFIAMGALFIFSPLSLIGVAIGIGGGLMYSLRIPLVGKRIKQIPLIKSVYVPAILVAYCFITPWVFPQTPVHWVVVGLIALAFAINVSLFDLRDADRDKSAGIVTVANFFGKRGLLLGIWPITLAITAVLLWDSSPAMIAAVASVWAVSLSSLRLWKPAPMWYYAIIIDGTMIVPLAVLLALDGYRYF